MIRSTGTRGKTRSRVILLVLLVAVPLVLLAGSAAAGYALDEVVVDVVGIAAYGGVAGIIILRRDGHPVGWLLLALGATIISVSRLAGFPGVSPTFAGWVEGFGWPFLFSLFAALTLVFPSGHLPPGNGWLARLGRAAGQWLLPLLLIVILVATDPFTGERSPWSVLPGWVWFPSWFGVLLILLGGAVSLVVRRRHSTGAERAQLGWVVLPLALLTVAILVAAILALIPTLTGGEDPGDDIWTPAYVAMLSFPIAFGVAVLRYRLYDIDRIISRTVTYALVSAVLIGVYLGAVFVLGNLLPLEGELAVAGSTLLAAALFDPLRRRIQRIVDRRFNRSRFDAERLIEALSRRLSSEVDLASLGRELQVVASHTMQPTNVSVRLKGESG